MNGTNQCHVYDLIERYNDILQHKLWQFILHREHKLSVKSEKVNF